MVAPQAVECGSQREQEIQRPAERFLYYGGLFHIRGAIVRMNIDIDDRLLSAAMRAGGCKTKRATVEEGLRLLARNKAYRTILQLRGTIHWAGDSNARAGDSNALQRDKARVRLKVAKAG